MARMLTSPILGEREPGGDMLLLAGISRGFRDERTMQFLARTANPDGELQETIDRCVASGMLELDAEGVPSLTQAAQKHIRAHDYGDWVIQAVQASQHAEQ